MTLADAALRTVAWPVVALCVVVSAVAAWQDALLVSACVLALAFAGAVDEPSAELAVSAPAPATRVRALRVALVAPVVAVAWVASTALTDAPAPGAVTLAALPALSIGVAATGVRLRPGLGGAAFAGPALLVVLVDGGRYLDGDVVWLGVAAVSIAVLVAATRDPAAGRYLPSRGSSNTLAFWAGDRA